MAPSAHLAREAAFGPLQDLFVQFQHARAGCGLLSLAERQQGLVREGLLLPAIDGRRAEGMDILVLTAADPSLYSEAVGWAGQRWTSAEAMQADRETEGELEVRHRSMLPTLEVQITSAGRGQSEATSRELDRYFHQWAQIYLRRMPYCDMIDGEEQIGGVDSATTSRSSRHSPRSRRCAFAMPVF